MIELTSHGTEPTSRMPPFPSRPGNRHETTRKPTGLCLPDYPNRVACRIRGAAFADAGHRRGSGIVRPHQGPEAAHLLRDGPSLGSKCWQDRWGYPQGRDFILKWPSALKGGAKIGETISSLDLAPAFVAREGDWKLIHLPDRLPMLYNLAEDLSEQHDVAIQDPDLSKALMEKCFF
jgi:hypothetical protein